MKFINPKMHGVLDFVYIALLAAAPSLFNFTGLPATICYIFACAVLGLVLLTRYQYGLIKVIPFPVHGMVELVASIAFIAMPWLLGFTEIESARNFFVAAGALLFGVYLCTDYRAAERTVSLNAERREHVELNR